VIRSARRLDRSLLAEAWLQHRSPHARMPASAHRELHGSKEQHDKEHKRNAQQALARHCERPSTELGPGFTDRIVRLVLPKPPKPLHAPEGRISTCKLESCQLKLG
jgi:hypothetical protein